MPEPTAEERARRICEQFSYADVLAEIRAAYAQGYREALLMAAEKMPCPIHINCGAHDWLRARAEEENDD